MLRKISKQSGSKIARIAKRAGIFQACALLFAVAGFAPQFALGQEAPIEIGRPEMRRPDLERREGPTSGTDVLFNRSTMEARDKFYGGRFGLHVPGHEATPLEGLEARRTLRLVRPLSGFELAPQHGLVDFAVARRQRPEYVRWVQESLNRTEKTHLLMDGVFSEETQVAVRKFQLRHGLFADGIVGDKTETRLVQLTFTHPPLREGLIAKSYLRQLSESLFSTPAESQIRRGMVFLDVRNRNGRVSASVSRSWEYFGAWQPVESKIAPEKAQELSSAAELELLIGLAPTVVHRGDELPPDWQKRLSEKTTFLRNSDRSPKQDVGEFIQAAQLLERKAEPGRVRVMNGLPHMKEKRALLRQLDTMDLNAREVEGWRKLIEEVDEVKARSPFKIEVADKAAFIQELREGDNDYVVLVAHYADGLLHFPDGSTLSDAELSAVKRGVAPNRTVVLISCSAGAVNGRSSSPSETVLGNRIAVNVLAHPEPISATQVPGMLRDYLIEGKSIKDAFAPLRPITRNEEPNAAPGAAEEIARLLPAR